MFFGAFLTWRRHEKAFQLGRETISRTTNQFLCDGCLVLYLVNKLFDTALDEIIQLKVFNSVQFNANARTVFMLILMNGFVCKQEFLRALMCFRLKLKYI